MLAFSAILKLRKFKTNVSVKKNQEKHTHPHMLKNPATF